MDWKGVYDETASICRLDPEYDHYAGREKMLAFVFTFLQQLNKNKYDYAPALNRSNPIFLLNAPSLRELKNGFEEFTGDLIYNATNSGEIQGRPLVANYYKNILWTGFVFILNYWARDHSDNQEKTDVFVEKTVHFMFDILAPGPVDSGVDLVRFLFQLRKSK